MRSLQGCHIVSALMIGCSSVQKHNKKNLRPGGYCPWPHDLRISRYAFRNLEFQWSGSCCQSTKCNVIRPCINGKEHSFALTTEHLVTQYDRPHLVKAKNWNTSRLSCRKSVSSYWGSKGTGSVGSRTSATWPLESTMGGNPAE